MDRRKEGMSVGDRKERGHAGGGRHPGGYGWLLGLLAGTAFFGIGMARGELQTIWQKAVMICMECIGIG